MREVTQGKRTLFVTDLKLPEGSTPLGMALWCAQHLNKKLDLNFADGTAEFIDKDDALTFEKEWN